MTRGVCSIDDCDRTIEARGWCKAHYTRWYKHGDPLAGSPVNLSAEDRFWSKVEKTETCWLWHGELNWKGYGRAYLNGERPMAHRATYEMLVGPIPEGLVLDHLCRVRHCVNPEHLEPVTNRENLHRGETLNAINAAKTHCKRGHELSGDNVRLSGVHRHCLTCRRLREAARRSSPRLPSLNGTAVAEDRDVPSRSLRPMVGRYVAPSERSHASLVDAASTTGRGSLAASSRPVPLTNR